MPQLCTVCRHRKRQEIDEALLASDPLRTIADRHGLSKTALIRHKAQHLPAHLATAKSATETLSASLLFHRLEASQENERHSNTPGSDSGAWKGNCAS